MSARGGGGLIALLALAAIVLLVDAGDRGGGDTGAGGEQPGRADRGQGGGVGGGERRGVRAQVLRVVDGDTIEVELDGREEDVRYIGVDTPETVKPGTPVECFGERSSAANKKLVEGRDVVLVFDRERRDHYGRLLAYVYRDGIFVNAELIRRGYARTLEIEPNTAAAGRLAALEQRASREGRGLWSSC